MDEQRPQRQGYSDLNERQEEGIPALETDERTGARPEFPNTSPGDVSGTQPDLVREASSDEGRMDDSSGSGRDEPTAGEHGATPGGQRSGGDGGESSETGG